MTTDYFHFMLNFPVSLTHFKCSVCPPYHNFNQITDEQETFVLSNVECAIPTDRAGRKEQLEK